jgi:hypothetical protein
MWGIKELPVGNFIYMRELPPDATDESVADFLSQYFPCAPRHVVVRNWPDGASAMISVDLDATMYLLEKTLADAAYPGEIMPVKFSVRGLSRDRLASKPVNTPGKQ